MAGRDIFPPMAATETVDLLAIAAHRDDVELTCGGTLAKAAKSGRRTAILDLTQGEMGTRGSAELRAAEAETAAGDRSRQRCRRRVQR